MFISKEQIINNQISVESNINIDMQNWVKFFLDKPYEIFSFPESFSNLNIDDFSNRLEEMRNAMMKTRFT